MPDDAAEYSVARSGVRLDKFLAESAHCGRRQARALIREGRVRVNGHRATAATELAAGQTVAVDREFEPAVEAAIEMPAVLDVVARGSGWFAVAKPAGVHSVAGASRHSVADLILRESPDAAEASPSQRDAGLVNRLDRDTSGVLLAATDRAAWLELREEFAAHRVEKQYVALVAGRVDAVVTVDQPLARRASRVRPPHRGEKAYQASTTFHPLESTAQWSLVMATMRTGVTHQIRAHAALAGHPILGDMKYGDVFGPAGTRSGHLLHALRLVVPGRLDVSARVAGDFRLALARLRAEVA